MTTTVKATSSQIDYLRACVERTGCKDNIDYQNLTKDTAAQLIEQLNLNGAIKPLKKATTDTSHIDLSKLPTQHGMIFKLVYRAFVEQEFLNEKTEQDFLDAVAYTTELYFKSLAAITKRMTKE